MPLFRSCRLELIFPVVMSELNSLALLIGLIYWVNPIAVNL